MNSPVFFFLPPEEILDSPIYFIHCLIVECSNVRLLVCFEIYFIPLIMLCVRILVVYNNFQCTVGDNKDSQSFPFVSVSGSAAIPSAKSTLSARRHLQRSATSARLANRLLSQAELLKLQHFRRFLRSSR